MQFGYNLDERSAAWAFERSVEADAATLLARRIYALATAAGWEAARDGLPPRRVVTVRA